MKKNDRKPTLPEFHSNSLPSFHPNFKAELKIFMKGAPLGESSSYRSSDSRSEPPNDFVQVPYLLKESVRTQIHAKLSPSAVTTLRKLTFTHAASSLITLLICPQFGANPFHAGDQWISFFMQFGDWACGIACGSLYLGATALLSLLTTSPEERRVCLGKGFWIYPALSAVSIGLLMLLGKIDSIRSSHVHLSLTFVSSWWVAAVLAAILISWMGNFVRASHSLRRRHSSVS